MPKIAIIHNPSSRHADVWNSWLVSADYSVDMIYDKQSFDHSKKNSFDLIIPLITIADFVSRDNARIEALLYFEAKGLSLLTSYSAIVASSDKLMTARVLHDKSLPHPLTWLAEDFSKNDYFHGSQFILKPRFGHSGEGIRLLNSFDEQIQQNNSDILVQSFIDNAKCIRVIASENEVLSTYQKIPPEGEVIANVERGAKRQKVGLTEEMRDLATAAVDALGGGLMGLDILESPKGLYILEANVPFGFDEHNTQFRQRLTNHIGDIITSNSL